MAESFARVEVKVRVTFPVAGSIDVVTRSLLEFDRSVHEVVPGMIEPRLQASVQTVGESAGIVRLLPPKTGSGCMSSTLLSS